MSRGYVLFTSTQPTARMCEAGTLCKQVFNFQKDCINQKKNRKCFQRGYLNALIFLPSVHRGEGP